MSDQPSVRQFTDYVKKKECSLKCTHSEVGSSNTTTTPIWVGGNIIYDSLPTGQMEYIKLECLRMAIQHATPDQVNNGAVYQIANDYYNYIVNGK